MESLRALTQPEISLLQNQGCQAESWELIRVAAGFRTDRIQRATFSGRVELGDNSGSIRADGLEKPCGIYDAAIAGCRIGNHVRIAQIGSVISRYDIAESALIEGLFSMAAAEGGSFGVGETLDVLNEAGGRSVLLFPGLSSQTAWIMAMLPQHREMQKKLRALIEKTNSTLPHDRGVIGPGASLRGCGSIENVHIGTCARLHGVAELRHATILSCAEHPTLIGSGVQGRHLLIAEGAQVESGALLEKCFVGQGVQLGKNLSAENTLFFANCEGFHSEMVSVFAGPYTVTHHRSTLLIASLFSFYNAGSGTNQSNHMYKLGPVHQGVFERGSKTGSFSYNLLESHIPAFTVVIGKHLTNLDIPALPFSYITEEAGQSWLMPAINLFSIGTVRDGAKWPKRDRRKAPVKRDRLSFDIFSPYTIEKMRQAKVFLENLYQETPREQESLLVGGARISRLMLRKGAKYYGLAIDRYLLGHLFNRLAPLLERGAAWPQALERLDVAPANPGIRDWMDLGGLLAPRQQLLELVEKIGDGRIDALAGVEAELDRMQQDYAANEWAYFCDAAALEYEKPVNEWTPLDAEQFRVRWQTAAISLLALTIEDANKEFAAFSHIGYGADLDADEKGKDFLAVRGEADSHSVIEQLKKERQVLEAQGEYLKTLLAASAEQA
jgi:hypothetical protein